MGGGLFHLFILGFCFFEEDEDIYHELLPSAAFPLQFSSFALFGSIVPTYYKSNQFMIKN